MRVVPALLVILAVLVVAGCGTEDERQADARHAVEEKVATVSGYTGEVRCTHNPRPWFISKPATVFICAANRSRDTCDLFTATLRNAGWEVVVSRPNADCILPQ